MNMTASALIIGLDGYAGEDALTSAVRDAVQFRDVLVQRGLVDVQNAELLTLPAIGGASPATARAIRDRLYHYYANGEQIDRFFFFFAGHGILANANASHTRTHTILVPTECEDFRRDAAYLWPFDELRETMERCGPREQFYLIDACRDLAEDRNPDVGKLGFSGAATSHARSQSVLFAVSPLGTARATRHGLGVMTGHLIDALQSDRLALDYDEDLGKFVITIQSLKRYVEARIRASLKSEPNWTLRYQLPELRSFGPSASPLAVVEPPPEVPLTVHIDPDRAAVDARISVYLRGSRVQEAWPPLANHQDARLGPQKYTLRAQHDTFQIEPEELSVDLRLTSEAHFRVQPGPARAVGTEAPGVPWVRELAASRAAAAATVVAVTAESATTIELEGQSPPYLRIHRHGRLEEEVAAGDYRVRFRLGDRVQSETEIEVSPGAVIEVRPALESSPLVYEAIGAARFVEATAFSETIGPMQSGVLQTLLAMIGVKHLDVANQVFHQLTGLIRPVAPDHFQRRPVVVIVALDGLAWREPPDVMLRRIDCDIDDGRGTNPGTLPIQLLAPGTPGFERIGVALGSPGAPHFFVSVRSPELRTIRVASASLEGRATVVTVVFHPDGRADIGQALLAFPGEPDPHAPLVPYGKLLRAVQLGQLLYRSDELIGHMLRADDELFRALRLASWVDPVVTAMAILARQRAVAAQALHDPQNLTAELEHTAARRLFAQFGELPDSRIVHALAFPDRRDEIFDELLRVDAVPILADAAIALAARARQTHRDAAVVKVVETMVPGEIWCLCREAANRGMSASNQRTAGEQEA